MERPITDVMICKYLHLVRERLGSAAAIAKAAEACADSGDAKRAVTILLEVEELTYEVNTLLNAASLINRLA